MEFLELMPLLSKAAKGTHRSIAQASLDEDNRHAMSYPRLSVQSARDS
jgi:hypothetical protein